MSLVSELKRRNVFKVGVAYGVVAWLLIQVADTLLPTFGAPEWVMPVFAAFVILGFPLALIFAWAFELTPEGIKPTHAVEPGNSKTQVTGQKLNSIIISVLSLAVVFLVIDNYVLKDESAPVVEEISEAEAVEIDLTEMEPVAVERDVLPNSVAVLLCDNLSPDPNDAYFAASIHEEILNQLVKIRALNVIARTSVLQYADAPPPIPQIAAELNVGAVMECSVRFAGDAIMVTAQLIDPTTNSHLWSETYPGDMSDLSTVFAMQADIAMNIANALEAEFSLAEQEAIGKQITTSAEAYTLYLKSISAGVFGSRDLEALDAAIALDPNFAQAYATKAYTIINRMRFGTNRTPEYEGIAISNAEMAVSIDPELAFAYVALAGIYEINWRRQQAQAAYARAYQLNPNDPIVVTNYATFMRALGEYDEAIRLGQIAANLDPNNVGLWHQLGVTYMHARDDELAFDMFQNVLALNPNLQQSIRELGWVYLNQGNTDKANELFRQSEAIRNANASGANPNPFVMGMSAIGYHRIGLYDEAQEFVEQTEQVTSTGASLAMAYLAIGENDNAYQLLEAAINSPEPMSLNATVELKVNRWDIPALNEPRFVELRNRMGYVD